MLLESIQPGLYKITAEVGHEVVRDLREELKRQGHVLTGKLSSSIKGRVETVANGVRLVIVGEDYGLSLNDGVSPERIPYSGSTGRGGTSKFIQGLIRFFQLRGLPTKDAKSAAFATAQTQKREGMPTRGSYRFTTNSRRKGFISYTVDEQAKKYVKMLESGLVGEVELKIVGAFKQIVSG